MCTNGFIGGGNIGMAQSSKVSIKVCDIYGLHVINSERMYLMAHTAIYYNLAK